MPPNPLSTPIRNRYFFGRLLGVDDLARSRSTPPSGGSPTGSSTGGALWPASTYGDRRSAVTVTPGVALDGWGREIVVVTATTEPIPAGAGAGPLEVVLCYAEEDGDPSRCPGR